MSRGVVANLGAGLIEPDMSRSSGCRTFEHLHDNDPEKPCACVKERVTMVPPCSYEKCKGCTYTYTALQRPTSVTYDRLSSDMVNKMSRTPHRRKWGLQLQ